MVEEARRGGKWVCGVCGMWGGVWRGGVWWGRWMVGWVEHGGGRAWWSVAGRSGLGEVYGRLGGGGALV